jgi:Subtilase family
VLINFRKARLGLAASSVLTAIVAAAWVAGPAAAAQAASATAAAGSGIPASAANQLASEMTAALQLTDGHGVTIAILDTQASQISELAGKLTIGPDYAPLPGASTTDGTVIASMIAGSGPTTVNAYGTTGQAPGASILSEGIWNPDNNSSLEKHYESDGVWQGIAAKAIRYAVDHGASVIVVGVSGGDSAVLDAAVAYALAKNAVVIGSSLPDENDANTLMYPDSTPGVINFSGTTLSGQPPPQSAEQYPTNDSVLITAPDNTLDATGPGNQPYQAWGYDSAVAWVAGTVALIKSLYPQISPAMVASALAMSASYHPAGGYNTTIGYGLINPLGALHEAASLVNLRATAKPGPGVLSAAARFGAAPPATIHAVRHSIIELAGFGAAIIIGAALLALAFRLRARGRRAGAHKGPPVTGAAPLPEAAAPPPEPA